MAPNHNAVSPARIALGVVAMLALTVCSTGPKEIGVRFPYEWIDTPGFGGTIDRYGFKEPSGIVFHPLRKTLFVVSDEGEAEEISTDGERLSWAGIPGDLEDITIHPGTGKLYIVVEGDDVILECDPDSWEVTRRFFVGRKFDGDPEFIRKTVQGYDNGLESLTFVPDAGHPEGGTFFAGNQWDPPAILELEVPLESSGAEGGEARIIRVLPFKIDDPAAMSYDAARRVLCVVSDADNIYVELDLEGNLVAEYAFPGDNQEGLAWDEEGHLYIAQDSGGILKVRDLRRRQGSRSGRSVK